MGTTAGVTLACREHGGKTSSSLIILLRTVSEVGQIRTWLQLVGCALVKTPRVLTSEADRGLRSRTESTECMGVKDLIIRLRNNKKCKRKNNRETQGVL